LHLFFPSLSAIYEKTRWHQMACFWLITLLRRQRFDNISRLPFVPQRCLTISQLYA